MDEKDESDGWTRKRAAVDLIGPETNIYVGLDSAT